MKLLTIICLTLASHSVQAQSFGPNDVPFMLTDKGGAGVMRIGKQEGRLCAYGQEQKVVISWIASAIANQPPNWSLQFDPLTGAMGSAKPTTAEQEIPTRFYPTSAAVVSSDTVVIGGMTSDSKTLVEKWTFQWPSPMPAPTIDPVTQLSTVPVAMPTITSRVRIYEDAVTGKRIVRNMCALRRSAGPPNAILVHFHDSQDLYKMDLSSGQFTLLASATLTTGTLGQVAGLGYGDQYAINFGDRSQVGYVYSFVRGFKVAPSFGATSGPPVVTLLDYNRDGTPETAMQMTEADYVSQGWMLLDNYIDWWLY